MKTKKEQSVIFVVCFFTLFLFPVNLLAEVDPYYGSERDPVNSKPYEVTNGFSGSFGYSYPIILPPGRNDVMPELNLIYNNQDYDIQNLLGFGWSINIPYIKRLNRKGVDVLFSDNYFESSLGGELRKKDDNCLYGCIYTEKIVDDFKQYEYRDDSYWLVTDKNGLQYKFGVSISARQDDPGNGSHVYKWMLEEVRDLNGNYVKFSYFKDNGQIYPDRIVYTGYNDVDGPVDVLFSREARLDKVYFNDIGFKYKTNYRISEIIVNFSSDWVKKYNLNYGVGDNGVKSMLQGITEYGRDTKGDVISLPSTDFEYYTMTKNWVSKNEYIPPSYFDSYGNDSGARLTEINGDGLTDFVYRNESYHGGFLNNCFNSGWISDYDFIPPYYIVFDGFDSGAHLFDVNGDSFDDYVVSDGYFDYYGVWINNGDESGWTRDDNYLIPVDFAIGGFDDAGTLLGDVNGDMLTDLIYSSLSSTSKAYINKGNGTGWERSDTYVIPTKFTNQYDEGIGVRIVDINGDGLDDIIRSDYLTFMYVWINKGNGTGWELDYNYSIPVYFLTEGGLDNGVRFVDINSDGLVDIVHGHQMNDTKDVYINKGNGTGWEKDENYLLPLYFIYLETEKGWLDNGVRVAELNGDGIPDFTQYRWGVGGSSGHISEGTKPDLIKKITTSKGEKIEVEYKGSPEYIDDNNNLLNPESPFVLQTVYKITKNDGLGNISITTYEYSGGDYYYSNEFDRRFAGFGEMTETDSEGNVTKTYYHQGNDSVLLLGEHEDDQSKIGKIYRKEIFDSEGNLYSKIINKWENYDLGNDRDFVKLTQVVDFSYDGDTDHRDKASTYAYENEYGNLVQKTYWGEVAGSDNGTFIDTGSDLSSTTISYAASTSLYIVGLPSSETTYDQGNNKVKESKYYYDNLAQGEVEKGNLTKEERWVAGNDYIDIEKTYNDYGLVTQEKDPRDKATNYVYDQYNLYVATSTNALGQSTQYYYDYSSGKPKKTIDANGLIFETVYDGFDRVLEEKQPDTISPSILAIKARYSYYDNIFPRCIEQESYLTDSTSTVSYNYFDGLGRIIQERKQSENSVLFSVKDYIYDERGLLRKESLPYFSSGASSTQATTTQSLYTEYLYNALNRIFSSVNAIGTTTSYYDDWKITIVDVEGNQKSFYSDAYGNLVKVEEYNNGSTYSTIYDYDLLGNLIKITDALNNVRNFTYDSLGRLLVSQDLHEPADSTFGSILYLYDDSGNVIMKVDAKWDSVSYTYDDINRILSENYTRNSGIEVDYAYDNCENGIGRLCVATTSDVVSLYEYNPLGLVKTEVKSINSVNYETDYDYDRHGNAYLITYPDNSQVKYVYNAGGRVERVQQKESGENFRDIIVNYDYNPLGQIEFEHFSNSIGTYYNYNEDELYRLRNRKIKVLYPDYDFTESTYSRSLFEFDPTASFFNSSEILSSDTFNEDLSDVVDGGGDTFKASSSDEVVLSKKELSFEAGEKILFSNKQVEYDGNYIYHEETIDGEKYWFETILQESSFEKEKKVTKIEDNKTIFENLDGKIKIEQEAFENSLKETITLEDDSRGFSFKYNINTSDNIDVSKEYGMIILQGYNGKGTLEGSKFRVDFQEPFAVDANGIRYEYEYVLNDDSFTMKPKEDMTGVVFPLTIDPTYIVFSYTLGQSIILAVPGEQSIARTSNGRLHVIYGNRFDSSSVHCQMYNYSNDNGETWGIPYIIDVGSVSGSSNGSLYVDKNDNVLVIYKDNYIAKSKKYNGSFWSSEIPLNIDPYFRGAGSFDSSGVFHFIANTQSGWNQDLVYLFWNGSSWSSETMIVDATYRASYPTTQIDSNNTIHLVYLNRDSSDNVDTDVYYMSKPSGGGWSSPVNIEQAGTELLNSATMVVDSNDNLHLTYRIDHPQNEIAYKMYNGTSWLNAIELTDYSLSSWEILSPEIGMKSDNKPYIVYSTINSTSERQVGYIEYDGYHWSETGIFSDSNEVYTGSVFAIWQEFPVINNINYNSPAVGFVALYECDNESGGEELCIYIDPTLVWSEDYSYGVAPGAPTDLLLNGENNPVGLLDFSPKFSAIYNDGDVGDSAVFYQLRVATTSENWDALVWDTGRVGMSTTTEGYRCQDIEYNGPELSLNGEQYYWHIRFWDDEGNEGEWSTSTAYFRMVNNTLQNTSYYYDKAGNIIEIDEISSTSKDVYYTYDDLYRLASASSTNSATGTDYLRTYLYNAVGNITNKSDIGSYVYTDNGYNNPHAVTLVNGAIYTYDSNGNLTSDSVWTHTWDYNNRLRSSTNGTITITYGYDHEGNRVIMDDGTTETYYPNKLYNITSTGTTTKHVFNNDKLIATIDNDSSTKYIHTDHLGGSNIITNENGDIVQLLDYYPYGGIRLNETPGNIDEKRKAFGHEYDDDSELYYMVARYYDGNVGRFISQDPMIQSIGGDLSEYEKSLDELLANPQSLNSYSYTINNPLKYIDPTGETYTEATGGYFVGIGQSLWGTAKGLASSIAHPINTVKGMGTSIANAGNEWKQFASDVTSDPKGTMSQIGEGTQISYNEFMDMPDYEKGKAIGRTTEKVMEAVTVKKVSEGLAGGNLRQTTLGADKGVQFGKYNVGVDKYNRGGGGINLRDTSLSQSRPQQRIFGVDYHSFKFNGEAKSRLHYHSGTGSAGAKHRPYQK